MIAPSIETQGKNEESPFSAGDLKIKRAMFCIVTFIIISILISALYLNFAWNRYKEMVSSEAIVLAQSLESFIHTEHVEELSGGPGDLENLEYILIKENLIRLVETTNPIYSAYIFDERDGNIVILVDSEQPDSTDYSPPGQLYDEASDNHREPFRSGKTIITEKTTDRWGAWISVLVPIKDPNSEDVIAALGTDYSASEWQLHLWMQMIPDIIIVLSILVLFGALLIIWRQHSILKILNKVLRESERSKSVLLSHIPGMAYRCNCDRDWTMQYVSAGCLDLTGYEPESLLYSKDLSFNDLIAPEYKDLLWMEWERIVAMKQPFKYEYEIITAQGERKWVLEMGQGIYDEQGEVEALEGIVLDISDRKEIENNLRYNNEHNSWTGLHNRRFLENLLKQDAKAKTMKKRAIIGINLNSIHTLSLTYGFHYSQELIKKIADDLSPLCTSTHQIFHTYDNRFVFYIKEYEDKDALTSFCNIIVSRLESVFTVDRIGGGIGIIEIDEDNEHDIDQLLKNVLIASEKALHFIDKNLDFCFFDKVMEDQIMREEDIKQELALIEMDANDGGLFMQYQPILDLKSDQICGFEALARIESDKLGLISPLEFIPIAEKTKQIIPFGQKVIIQVFQFINKLKEKGYSDISVSINISAIQLMSKDFTKNLFDTMYKMYINPEDINLEITESMFTDNYQEINHILGELKNSGIHIAIDDFGTGYSSLAREQELNITCLKIDKYFIDKLVSLNEMEAITGDIISMAHKLGHYVIAEGVESEKQRQYLKNHGCDKIQGYLISKPLDEEVAIKTLNSK